MTIKRNIMNFLINFRIFTSYQLTRYKLPAQSLCSSLDKPDAGGFLKGVDRDGLLIYYFSK